jgi:hypothetical protein
VQHILKQVSSTIKYADIYIDILTSPCCQDLSQQQIIRASLGHTFFSLPACHAKSEIFSRRSAKKKVCGM